jgi:radical SAM protein with 4Fe4S-binding SPASM domain
MPLDNVRKVINFLQKSKVNEVGIIGGEPTLHPQFIPAIKLILRAGLNIRLFTNGIILPKYIDFLSSLENKRCEILINIHSPRFYSPKEMKNLNQALFYLNQKVALGFTIFEKYFSSNFMLPIIEKYNLKRSINISQAHKLLGFENIYLPLSQRKFVARRIVDFAQACDKKDITLSFDCGFTLCSFSAQSLGRLRLYGAITNMNCNPVIDVGPDLTIWRCFATSKIWNKKLNDFDTLTQIYKYYNEKSFRFVKLGNNGKCLNCKYMRRLQCSGGCLASTLTSLDLNNNVYNLF